MIIPVNIIVTVLIISGFLVGIRLMQAPQTALWGNRLGALCMLLAVLYTVYITGLLTHPLLWLYVGVGAVLGLILGQQVQMIQMPQAVALLNGLGGAASALVAGVAALSHPAETALLFWLTGALALAIGVLTFSGSIVAALKLQGWISQRPFHFKAHNLLLRLLLVAGGVLIILDLLFANPLLLFPIIALVFAIYGILMALRVGGADMPIIISLLNSFSGVAASVCGLAVNDGLLTGVGALVGVAGLVLTQIMCRAMNRSLPAILGGFVPQQAAKKSEISEKKATVASRSKKQLPEILKEAQKVIIVPGYGMAVAQAQQAVKGLVDALKSGGKDVKIAVHPVAGRMPGHMNVLLAEVGIEYDMLFDMEMINPEFPETDLVIVVGACDVINPAATTAENTPIYGMPILEVDRSKYVVVCNRDQKPGYSGVENSLYDQDQVITRWGDAAETVPEITAILREITL